MNDADINHAPVSALTQYVPESIPQDITHGSEPRMDDGDITDATYQGNPDLILHAAPLRYFRKSNDNEMDFDNINHLLEALDSTIDEPAHGTVMKALMGEYVYNWLDAASSSWLAENTDNIILALAGRMAIRYMALQEMKFDNHGYTGYRFVTSGLLPESLVRETEKHTAFYLKTKGRLEKLARLDSINRRSQLAVLQFPTKVTAHQSNEPGSKSAEIGEVKRDLVQTYELMRRSHLGDFNPIVQGPGWYRRDWLDDATQAELVESTDAILFAGHARMAIRMSLRLEKSWRQSAPHSTDPEQSKNDLLHDIRKERDRAVDSYLKLLEARAKAEHNQGIVTRSETGSALRKPRRPRMRTKKIATA